MKENDNFKTIVLSMIYSYTISRRLSFRRYLIYVSISWGIVEENYSNENVTLGSH